MPWQRKKLNWESYSRTALHCESSTKGPLLWQFVIGSLDGTILQTTLAKARIHIIFIFKHLVVLYGRRLCSVCAACWLSDCLICNAKPGRIFSLSLSRPMLGMMLATVVCVNLTLNGFSLGQGHYRMHLNTIRRELCYMFLSRTYHESFDTYTCFISLVAPPPRWV